MRTIDTSGDLKLKDGNFHITGSAGSLYRLQNLATGEHSSEHISDILPRLIEVPEWPAISPGDLQTLHPQDRSETDAMASHIEEMVTGARPGHDLPREQYDPATTSQNERVLTKAAELNDRGIKAARASLYKKKTLWLQGGAAGLIDHRKTRSTDRFARADQDVLDVIAHVIAKFHKMSTVTETRLHYAVEAELNLRFPGKGTEMCPSRATLYRYFALLGRSQHVTGKATTRRSAGLVPKRRNVTMHRMLPGEEVQVDSTWADIMVIVPGYDKPQRPRITIMIDKATRSIIASTIRLVAANGYDHALLLAQALTPYQARPDRATHRALLAARHTGSNLLSSAERAELERTRPYIFPRRIVSDNGKDFLSPSSPRPAASTKSTSRSRQSSRPQTSPSSNATSASSMNCSSSTSPGTSEPESRVAARTSRSKTFWTSMCLRRCSTTGS
jgi:putative transposase